jgi:hypothetical protein
MVVVHVVPPAGPSLHGPVHRRAYKDKFAKIKLPSDPERPPGKTYSGAQPASCTN